MEDKYIVGAGVLGGLAVVATAIAVFTGSENASASCSLTTAAAGAIVAWVSKGRAVDEIVGPATASAAVPLACKPVVEALLEQPDETVQLEVQDAGESLDMTGSELLGAPAPAPAPLPTCDDWLFQSARDLCYQGQIGPPIL